MKLLLVVIDAVTPHVVCAAVHTGRLPVLRALADAGEMHEASVTIFPSITPAATTSIITLIQGFGFVIRDDSGPGDVRIRDYQIRDTLARCRARIPSRNS